MRGECERKKKREYERRAESSVGLPENHLETRPRSHIVGRERWGAEEIGGRVGWMAEKSIRWRASDLRGRKTTPGFGFCARINRQTP